MISSDESQSKEQFNLQISGENKTFCRAENIKFVSIPQMKSSRKVHMIYIVFYTLLKGQAYCYAKQC